jgi:hypothetical protein
MEQCIQCSKEFEPIFYKGSKQTYCSKTCRTKAGNERYKLKLMTNGISETGIGSNTGSTGTELNSNIGRQSSETFVRDSWRNNTSIQNANTYNDELIRFVEKTYEARTEANKYELKYEMALKEIEALKQEVVELELELEEQPEPKQGFIGGITDLLEGMPEWLAPAVGKLLQSDKVQKFVISQIPEPEKTNQ